MIKLVPILMIKNMYPGQYSKQWQYCI